MSNLASIFDTQRGWPDDSALEHSFLPEPGVTLVEGDVVTAAWRQMDPAEVLNVIDDSLNEPPGSDAAGDAYFVGAVPAGLWVGFGQADLVEFDGTDWVLILAAVAAEPPDNTRVVVTQGTAAGSFVGEEGNVMVYDTGTSTWPAGEVETPEERSRILIDAVLGGVYDGKQFDYLSDVWTFRNTDLPMPVHVEKLTQLADLNNPQEEAWLVIQGNDQFDGKFVNSVACVKLCTGITFKIASLIADTLVINDRVSANAGVLEKTVAGGGMKHSVGTVIFSNLVADADGDGYIIVAS